MSVINNINDIYDFARDEAVNSQLPGREEGPADAYRHILGAAEAIRQGYPEGFVRLWGNLEEIFSRSDIAEMDRRNVETPSMAGMAMTPCTVALGVIGLMAVRATTPCAGALVPMTISLAVPVTTPTCSVRAMATPR